jgi:nitrite reductase/ring-hydroxylating ferredoxin subunit
MYMLGHEHEGNELPPTTLVRRIDVPTQFPPPVVIRKQRQRLITGKCEFMEMAGLMIVPNRLALSCLLHNSWYDLQTGSSSCPIIRLTLELGQSVFFQFSAGY